MQYSEFVVKYTLPYFGLQHLFNQSKGYIVWRLGTGGNVELLHIKAFKKRKGYGKELVKVMLLSLKKKPPYYSVFGFTKRNRPASLAFYRKLGFKLVKTTGPYKDSSGVMFYQSYKVLCRKLLGEES